MARKLCTPWKVPIAAVGAGALGGDQAGGDRAHARASRSPRTVPPAMPRSASFGHQVRRELRAVPVVVDHRLDLAGAEVAHPVADREVARVEEVVDERRSPGGGSGQRRCGRYDVAGAGMLLVVRIVIAPDTFKGTLYADGVADGDRRRLARVLPGRRGGAAPRRRRGRRHRRGGAARRASRPRTARVTGPDGRPRGGRRSPCGDDRGGRAGHRRGAAAARPPAPLTATTRGVGELVLARPGRRGPAGGAGHRRQRHHRRRRRDAAGAGRPVARRGRRDVPPGGGGAGRGWTGSTPPAWTRGWPGWSSSSPPTSTTR